MMIPRIAGTVLLAMAVFVVVTLLVSLGVLWLTGGVLRGAVIGVVCGLAAAFVVGSVGTAVGRTGERPGRRVGDGGDGSGNREDRRTR
jgi:hypothetical protein